MDKVVTITIAKTGVTIQSSGTTRSSGTIKTKHINLDFKAMYAAILKKLEDKPEAAKKDESPDAKPDEGKKGSTPEPTKKN
ncbi:MAG: hypothetical protein WDN31_00965 [Hyphomicrobium sp.]